MDIFLNKQKRALFIHALQRNGARSISTFFGEHDNKFVWVLKFAALLSLALMLSAMVLDNFSLASTSLVITIIFATMIIGLYMFVSILEHVVAKYFIEFKTSQLFWVVLIAAATYVAKGYAAEEVNEIFGRAAAMFPFAYTAATAMEILSLMRRPAVVIIVASLLYGLVRVFRPRGSEAFIALVMSFNFFSFGLFIERQITPHEVRKSNIYQIAVAMDFNGRFTCPGVQEKANRVAFVDSDQTRGLVAPPLQVKTYHVGSTFKVVEVPPVFKTVACL